jgi:hypothetical protein
LSVISCQNNAHGWLTVGRYQFTATLLIDATV